MLQNLPPFVQNTPQIGVIAGAVRNYYGADDKLFHWRHLAIATNLADDRKASCLFSSQIK